MPDNCYMRDPDYVNIERRKVKKRLSGARRREGGKGKK